REGAKATIRVEKHPVGWIELQGLGDGSSDSLRGFNRLRAWIDYAEPEFLAGKGQESASALGGVFEHELLHVDALEMRRQRMVAPTQQRRFVLTPVTAADVQARAHPLDPLQNPIDQ